MISLTFPFTEAQVRALKVGEEVLISGVVFTGRDAVHKYLHEGGALPPQREAAAGAAAGGVGNVVAELAMASSSSLVAAVALA